MHIMLQFQSGGKHRSPTTRNSRRLWLLDQIVKASKWADQWVTTMALPVYVYSQWLFSRFACYVFRRFELMQYKWDLQIHPVEL